MTFYNVKLENALRQYIDGYRTDAERNKLKALLASESVKTRYAVLKKVRGTEHCTTLTGVHEAAYANDLEIIKEMLNDLEIEQKYDIVKRQDEDDETALHKAASKGSSLIICYLMDGFTPKQKYELLKLQDKSGDTALHEAALRENTEVVETILSAVTYEKQTKLMNIENHEQKKFTNLNPRLEFASPTLNHIGIVLIFNVYQCLVKEKRLP